MCPTYRRMNTAEAAVSQVSQQYEGSTKEYKVTEKVVIGSLLPQATCDTYVSYY